MLHTALTLNFEFTATNIIGAICIVLAVVVSIFCDKIYKLVKKVDYAPPENTNMIRIVALIFAVLGAILIINY